MIAAVPAGFGITTGLGAAATAQTAQSPPVKFYIVRPEFQGQPEFLFEIAQRFLGNGNLFPEIFSLNQGRLQPDGQRLTNPGDINAGWILQLPSNASGPGVRFGPLPAGKAGQSADGGSSGLAVGIGLALLAVAGPAGAILVTRRRRSAAAAPAGPAAGLTARFSEAPAAAGPATDLTALFSEAPASAAPAAGLTALFSEAPALAAPAAPATDLTALFSEAPAPAAPAAGLTALFSDAPAPAGPAARLAALFSDAAAEAIAANPAQPASPAQPGGTVPDALEPEPMDTRSWWPFPADTGELQAAGEH